MKYLVALCLFPLLLFQATTQKQDIVGKWTGESKNEIGAISFDKDGYAAFEIKGEILGGKEFYMNGEKGKMTYTVDYNTSPLTIDFTLTKVVSGESKIILGIAEFINDNTLNFNLSFDGVRPSEFNENSIVLKRAK